MFDPHTPDELAGFTKPASVDGCLVEYYYVESAQAAIQVRRHCHNTSNGKRYYGDRARSYHD